MKEQPDAAKAFSELRNAVYKEDALLTGAQKDICSRVL